MRIENGRRLFGPNSVLPRRIKHSSLCDPSNNRPIQPQGTSIPRSPLTENLLLEAVMTQDFRDEGHLLENS